MGFLLLIHRVGPKASTAPNGRSRNGDCLTDIGAVSSIHTTAALTVRLLSYFYYISDGIACIVQNVPSLATDIQTQIRQACTCITLKRLCTLKRTKHHRPSTQTHQNTCILGRTGQTYTHFIAIEHAQCAHIQMFIFLCSHMNQSELACNSKHTSIQGFPVAWISN